MGFWAYYIEVLYQADFDWDVIKVATRLESWYAPTPIDTPISAVGFRLKGLLSPHQTVAQANCALVVRRSPSEYNARMAKTLFERIADGEIPGEIVYKDDKVFAFRDVKPGAPTHVLIVPRKVIPRIAEAKPEDHQVLGHLLLKAAQVAEQLGLKEKGYRLVINNGPDAGESVPHLHMHILGGRHLSWPPG